MSVEYEIKFSATAALHRQLLQDFPGETVHFDMQTTYYDTPDHQLSARKITIRRRLENGHGICTVKLPLKTGKLEIEAAGDDIFQALPNMDLPEDLSLFLQVYPLVPVCGAAFHRIAITVPISDGVVELALDCGELTGGGRTAALCEIEAELKQGEPAALDLFADCLAEKYGLIRERRSKFVRAAALSRGETI